MQSPDGTAKVSITFQIWVHRELGAVLVHDRDSGFLSLSIHPSRIHLEGHLVYLLWCGRRDL